MSFLNNCINSFTKWVYRYHQRPVDPELILSHNLFLMSSCVAIVLTSIFSLLYFVNGMHLVSVIQLMVSITCISCLFIFRKTGSIQIPGHIIFAMLFLASWYRVHLFGGIKAPTFYTYVLIPVFSLGFFPTLAAMFWTLSFISLALGYHFADQLGFQLVSQIPSGKEAALRISGIIFANMISFLIVYMIRNTHRKYQKIIEKEKENKTDIIRVISHDIVGPLMILQHNLKVLSQQGDNKNINSAMRAEQAIRQILNNLREYESIEEGRMQFNIIKTSLREVIESLNFMQHKNLVDKNCQLRIVGNVSISVFADLSALVFQVLNNLVSNAVKFSEPNSEIVLEIIEEEENVRLKVIDRGIGIPNEILFKINQSHMPTTRLGTKGEKGTGFGLPIVKTTIEKMGGAIEIASREKSKENSDSGTTVTLTLKKAA